ncbi:DUF1295 domain-containing protein [Leucobacter exalbidus]|uniref:DUF1295 domain-containing protein n=1 Tax=Leucobacter exalbidus TaxID=662960 RepID=UPI001AE7D985
MPRQLSTSVAITVVAVLIGAALAFAGAQNGWLLGPLPGFVLAVGIAYAVQWIVFIPAAITRTDRYFDLTASLTYISGTVALLLIAPELDLRSIIIGALVIIWAGRLGTFLFTRNIRSGGDDRFDDIKSSPARFLSVWTLQGLWISLTAAAAWITITSDHTSPMNWISWVGVAVWATGFGIEVIADQQKTKFKADPSNAGKFIRTGLWSVVRHPNYLGEMMLWTGVLIVALPALQGWQWVAILSPIFVVLLITKVTGIPMLDEKAKRKWGDDPEYIAYRKRTPALIPGLRG